MRKAIKKAKRNPPDFVVAEFVYGWGNNYAGVNLSNLDVLLYALEKFAPDTRVIVFADKDERPHVDRLLDIFIANGAPWADRRRRDFFSCERGAAAWRL